MLRTNALPQSLVTPFSPRHSGAFILLSLGLLAASPARAQTATLVRLPAPPATVTALTGSSAVSALPDAPGLAAPAALPGTPHLASQMSAAPPTASYTFPTLPQREHHFLADLIGPTAFIAPAFQAGIDQLRPLKVGYPQDGFPGAGEHPAHGDIPEWGEGTQGYARRYASRFGQGLIATTSRYALGEALREDVSYHRCQCTGLLPRAGHALEQAYLAHTPSGRAVPSLPALASPFIASEVAVAAWYPARYNTSDALRTSTVMYLSVPFKNLFSEFFAK